MISSHFILTVTRQQIFSSHRLIAVHTAQSVTVKELKYNLGVNLSTGMFIMITTNLVRRLKPRQKLHIGAIYTGVVNILQWVRYCNYLLLLQSLKWFNCSHLQRKYSIIKKTGMVVFVNIALSICTSLMTTFVLSLVKFRV